MNLHHVIGFLGDLVPSAKMLRFSDQGGGLYAAVCEIGGTTRCVRFDERGIYPNDDPAAGCRSELHIASDIAKELRK